MPELTEMPLIRWPRWALVARVPWQPAYFGVVEVDVALLGDGHVELAKHAHLAIDLSTASLCVPLAALARRFIATEALP
jgi:hypothetical protein